MQTITFVEPVYARVLFFDAGRFNGTEVELKSDTIDDRRNTYMLSEEFVAAARQILALPEVTQIKSSSSGKIEVCAFTRLSSDTYAQILEILDAFCAPPGSLYPPARHRERRQLGEAREHHPGTTVRV